MARSAARRLAEHLPEAVAAACIEFVFGPLADDPRRVGAPQRRAGWCEDLEDDDLRTLQDRSGRGRLGPLRLGPRRRTSITHLALSSSASARSARLRSRAISRSFGSAACRPDGRDSSDMVPRSRCYRTASAKVDTEGRERAT